MDRTNVIENPADPSWLHLDSRKKEKRVQARSRGSQAIVGKRPEWGRDPKWPPVVSGLGPDRVHYRARRPKGKGKLWGEGEKGRRGEGGRGAEPRDGQSGNVSISLSPPFSPLSLSPPLPFSPSPFLPFSPSPFLPLSLSPLLPLSLSPLLPLSPSPLLPFSPGVITRFVTRGLTRFGSAKEARSRDFIESQSLRLPTRARDAGTSFAKLSVVALESYAVIGGTGAPLVIAILREATDKATIG